MRSVTLKSAITPSFIGLMATMLPGVRPSISFASLPTASTSPVFLLIATIEGSLTTMPLPFAYTSVFAVPRSMARSEEKRLNKDRKFIYDDSLREDWSLRGKAESDFNPHGITQWEERRRNNLPILWSGKSAFFTAPARLSR